MRVIIQRVTQASVEVNHNVVGKISAGLLILVGFEEIDTKEDIEWTSAKISRLRIFNDDNGVMNKSLPEVGGNVLIVSQFTLFASTRKGNRPSWSRSAKPETAIPLYNMFIDQVKTDSGKMPETGIFGANMKVSLVNDGPVTIIIDSKNRE